MSESKLVFEMVSNIVGIGENAEYQKFFLRLQCFPKAFCMTLNVELCCKELKDTTTAINFHALAF